MSGETVSRTMEVSSSNREELYDNRAAVFLFRGQGALNFLDIAKYFEKDECFRGILSRCDEAIELMPSLTKCMEDIVQTQIVQSILSTPCYSHLFLFCLQVSSYETWRKALADIEHSGRQFNKYCIGHSTGEFAVAVAVNALPFDFTAKLIYLRARNYESTIGMKMTHAAMYATRLSEADARNIIKEILSDDEQSSIEIAAVNGPNNLVLSGLEDVIKKVMENTESVKFQKLDVHYPYHSPLMFNAESMLLQEMNILYGEYEQEINALVARDIRVISCHCGKETTGKIFQQPDYWYQQMISTVFYENCIETLLPMIDGNKNKVFIEVGPDHTMVNMTKPLLKSVSIDYEPFYLSQFQQLFTLNSTYKNELQEIAVDDMKSQLLIPSKIKSPNSTTTDGTSPSSEIEKRLASIWSFILQIPESKIFCESNFFDMGGYSLMVMNLISKIQSEWSIALSMKTIFQISNLKVMAEVVEEEMNRPVELNQMPAEMKISKREPPAHIPLTNSQQRMWFLEEMHPGRALYQVPFVLKLQGRHNEKALKEAYRAVIRRHEILRTRFVSEAGIPYQVVDDEKTFAELKIVAAESMTDSLDTYIAKQIAEPFDLKIGPLMRGELIVQNDEEAIFIVVMHHIITDGTSMQVYVKELSQWYEYYRRIQEVSNYSFEGQAETAEPLPFESLKLQFVDYTLWEKDMLEGESLNGQVTYWREKLTQIPEVINLPFDLPRPRGEMTNAGGRVDFNLSEETVKGLEKLAEKHKLTMYMLLLSAWQIVLHRYSGDPVVLVGSPFGNRRVMEVEEMIGFFVNTLVMRGWFGEKDLTVKGFLKQMQDTVLEAYDNADLPLEQLVQKLQVSRQTNVNPLFQVMFALEEFGLGGVQHDFGEDVRMSEWEGKLGDYEVAKFDLTLRALPVANKTVHFIMEYSKELFNLATVTKMCNHFVRVVEAMVKNDDLVISEIPMLSEIEVKQQLVDWNATACTYPHELLAHEMFEEHARNRPEATALVFEGREISYGELNARANRLAQYLRSQGIGVEEGKKLVGLGTDRSVEMIVGMLGILKAGGAYVPMDVAHPDDRLAFMLSDTGASHVLTQDHLIGRWEKVRQEIVNSDSSSSYGSNLKIVALNDELLQHCDTANVMNVATDNDLAYIIYTSGTTGKPKGVMLAHGPVKKFFCKIRYVFPMAETDVVLLRASMSFDMSAHEIFGCFTTGACGVLCNESDQKDVFTMTTLIEKNGVTAMILTPTLLSAFLIQENVSVKLKSLRSVGLGGEAVDNQIVRDMHRLLPNTKCYNGYGPTEATMAVTYIQLDTEKSVILGRPIDNVHLYVLYQNNMLLPVGCIGELYIGGDCLAEGYLNRFDLTAEKFITHQFKELQHSVRLYRTGDLVKYLPDGNLVYIGRIDNQVKIRGYRIELEEVEARLMEQHDVVNAAVVVKGEGANKYMVGYAAVATEHVHKDENSPVSYEDLVSRLRKSLGEHMPVYMIPQYFELIEKMPLTVNGKADRKALLSISVLWSEEEHKKQHADHVISEAERPKTATQIALAEMWSVLLHVQVSAIGLDSDFFGLGGHSLMVMSLIAKMQHEWKVNVSVKKVFSASRLSDMANVVDEARDVSQPSFNPPPFSQFPLVPQERPELIPLSDSQQRLWFLEEMHPGKALYQVPLVLKLQGHCNTEALKQAYKAMIQRHEILRTHFVSEGGKPYQMVGDAETIPGLVIVAAESMNVPLNTHIAKRIAEPFDLAKGPLMRGELIVLNGEEAIFIVIMHHIITDGASLQVYMKEMSQLYEYFQQKDSKMPLKPLSLQYVDYTLWQQLWLREDLLQGQANYWREKLKDIPEVINLPFDHVRPGGDMTNAGSRVDFNLTEETVKGLEKLAEKHKLTMYMLLLSAWQIVLHRYSGDPVVLVGSPFGNRRVMEVEEMIGFFVNTLVMRGWFGEKDLTVKGFLKQMQDTVLEAYDNADLPFEQLVQKLQVSRQTNVNPLFQVMFAYEEGLVGGQQHFGQGLKMSEWEGTLGMYEVAKFDLTLTATADVGKPLRCSMEYSTELFDWETVDRLGVHFVRVVEAMVKNDNLVISEIPMLSEVEVKQQLVDWNATACTYPHELLVHEMFEEHARNRPEATALVFEGREISYGELNARANRLAQYLRSQGIGVEHGKKLVGLGTDRSVEMIVGMLGILKAGGAYIPLDTAHPDDRLVYLLTDTGASHVLTQDHLVDRWEKVRSLVDAERGTTNGDVTVNIVSLDGNSQIGAYNSSNADWKVKKDDLAYIIYTSGTTGKPKGVMISHDTLSKFLINTIKVFGHTSKDVVLFRSSFAFDMSVIEIFTCLAFGACGILCSSSDLKDLSAMTQLVYNWKVTSIALTPTLLSIALMQPNIVEYFKSIRGLFIGGEAIDGALATRVHQTLPNAEFYNMFGPTEATVMVTGTKIEANQPLVLGKPLDNIQLYVLNQNKVLVPVGCIGELYIGGDSVGVGYLNRPDLTAEKFIWHQFKEFNHPTRLYRTGDLVKYLPDGNLVYVGRTDNQVKIRGYRIELEEVEARLMEEQGVLNAAVVVKGEGANKYLVGYVVVSAGENENGVEDGAVYRDLVSQYRKSLSERMPVYMIPSFFELIENMPLNVSGKADRKALLSIPVLWSEEEQKRQQAEELIMEVNKPESAIQKRLAELWSMVLQVLESSIGLDSDFFGLGGHSLMVMNLIAKMQHEWQVNVSVKKVFSASRLSDMANMLEETLEIERVFSQDFNQNSQFLRQLSYSLQPLIPQKRPERIPLSDSQQRMWVLEEMHPGKGLYQVPLVLKLQGYFDIKVLQQAFKAMIQRHEILRTRFVSDAGVPYQIVDDGEDIPDLVSVYVESMEMSPDNYIAKRIADPFDLTTGPLVRGELIIENEVESLLLVVMHHIITDGGSMQVYVTELGVFYDHYLSLQNTADSMFEEEEEDSFALAPPLDPLTLQYVDYTLWQLSRSKDGTLDRQASYWREKLTKIPEVINLPFDRIRPGGEMTNAGGRIDFDLSEATVKGLKKLIEKHNLTMYMLLLSAWQIVLHRYSGDPVVLVGSPFANRRVEEVQEMIGFFVNTLVMRASFEEKELTVRDFLEQMQDTVLEAYDNADLPFEQLVQKLQVSRQTNVNPLFQVMFAYEDGLIDGGGQRMFGEGLMMSEWEGTMGDYEVSKFDLTLSTIGSSGKSIHCIMEYSKELFNLETVNKMCNHFVRVVEAMVKNDDLVISEIPMLSEVEVKQQLVDWNATACTYPHELLVHEMFEEHARNRPEATALVFEGREISYGELNARANRLAQYLRSQGIGVENGKKLVGLGTDRSVEMIVGMLGILKAGGAYVPMDVAHPDDRLSYMLSHTEASHVLTQDHLVDRWEKVRSLVDAERGTTNGDVTVNIVSLSSQMTFDAYSSSNSDWKVNRDDLAYIIYTSGTTGKPKGVMIAHASLMNYLNSLMSLFNLKGGDSVLQRSSVSFDVSVHEILLPLICGARGVLCNTDEQKNVISMAQLIHTYQVTLVDLTPTLLSVLLSQQGMLELLKSLRIVFVGGEALSESLRDQCCLRLPHACLYNSYGPTEATVAVTYAPMSPKDEVVLMGKPLGNMQFYVVHEQSRILLPVGCVGELYIGGDCLAVGYLNRPDLTEERFITHQFKELKDPVRMYKTGDLVKFYPDGNLVYVGRTDNQVKIRGYRIELEEVEARLMEEQGVLNAAVVVKGEGANKYMVGYVIVESLDQQQQTAADSYAELVGRLRKSLEHRLPVYMVPSYLEVVAEMPLTVNGKIDRKALQALEVLWSEKEQKKQRAEIGDRSHYNTDVEKMLLDILSPLLLPQQSASYDGPSLTPTANIWQFGLNSMSVAIVAYHLSEKLKIPTKTSMQMINGSQTIEDITARVASFIAGNTEKAADDDWVKAAIEDIRWRPSVAETVYASAAVPVDRKVGVLVTGVTGFIGSVLIVDWLQNEDANTQIYVIARAQDDAEAKDRVMQQLSQLDGTELIDTSRIHFIAGDLSKPRFGLSVERYDHLSSQVDTVVHNAGTTSWTASYFQLRPPNVNATKEILQFCYHISANGNNHQMKRLCYISSMSASVQVDDDIITSVAQQELIEAEITNPATKISGYAASKAIAECLVRICSEQHHLPVCTFRLGAIAAHSTGYSNKTDFMSRLLTAVCQMKSIPRVDAKEIAGSVELTKVDVTSQLIRQYLHRENAFKNPVISLENPKSTPFADIFVIAKGTLERMDIPVQEVDVFDWVERIRNDSTNALHPLVDQVLTVLVQHAVQYCKNERNMELVQEVTNDLPYPHFDPSVLGLSVQWIAKHVLQK